MKVSEAVQLAKAIKLALTNAAKHGGASTDRGLGMRYGAYDIANETWHEIIRPAQLKRFPDSESWMKECGFSH